jgi:hypothetical protein
VAAIRLRHGIGTLDAILPNWESAFIHTEWLRCGTGVLLSE